MKRRVSERLAPRGDFIALSLVLILAVLLGLRASHAGLTYDEGTYLLSVLDIEGGQKLGTQVFAPQPPLFYDLVRLSGRLFGHDVADVRKGIVLVLLSGVVGAYLLVGGLVGRWAGIAAAAFIVVAPPVPLDAARVHADLPALALTLLALGLAAPPPRAERGAVFVAFLAGVTLVVASGVKLTALIGVVPITLLLVRSPRPRARVAAAVIGALLTLAIVLIVYRDALDALWSSLVDYRRAARRTPNLVSAREIVDIILDPHAAFTVALVVGAVSTALRLVRERSIATVSTIAPVILLVFLGGLALATYRPLHLNHLVLASVLLAVLAATLLGWGANALPGGAQRVIAVAVMLLALGALSQGWRRVGTELEHQPPDTISLAERLAQLTPASSLVVSDNPGIAYLARRRTPGALVDTARLRFDTGSLTDAAVLGEIDRSCVEAVVAARTFLLRPRLLRSLGARFRKVETSFAGRLYSGRRTPCTSGADTAAP